MQTEGKYIYCIMADQEKRDYGPVGIGGRGDSVHSVVYKDIAAAVSNSPVSEYSVSKENTLSHMKAIEMIMKNNTILPVKFSTVAHASKARSAEERIRLEILKTRYHELRGLLTRMTNKVELGIKAIWTDMEKIYREIVDENRDIGSLKRKISDGNPTRSYGLRINLGKMVKFALEAKRSSEEEIILNTFSGVYFDHRCNKTFGDKMITNSSFLVDKSRLEEFDKRVEKLVLDYKESMKFRYIGPVPPCNFVELTINL